MYVLYVWYTLLLVLSRALPMYRNETRIKIMNNGSGVKDNHIRDLLYSMVYLYLAKHNETTQPCIVNTKEQQKKIEIFHLYSLWSSSNSTSSSGKKRRIVCRENSINRSAVLTIRKKLYMTCNVHSTTQLIFTVFVSGKMIESGWKRFFLWIIIQKKSSIHE